MMEVVAACSAEPEVLWAVVDHVENWPRHLPTFTSVTALGAPGNALGARFRVRQPGLTPATYVVTERVPGSSFTWVARSPGVVTTATHTVSAAHNGSRLVLTLVWSGPLARVVNRLLAVRAARMMRTEATMLAAVAERLGPEFGSDE